MVAEISLLFFNIFQDGSHPPSWICRARIWPTQKEYLVVFIVVQSLVEIDQVVLIICKFSYFTILPCKCLFTPPKWGFGEFDAIMGNGCDMIHERHIPAQKHVIWRKNRRNRSNGCRDIAVFRFFFKMAAVRHLGFVECIFGPPAKSTWRSL